MKVKTVKLKDFKRFDDLTLELGENPSRIIALVGPNGSGKSSVFDAFEKIQRKYKNANRGVEAWFYAKNLFSLKGDKTDNHEVEAIKEDGTSNFDKKSFHIRTAYRFTDSLRVKTIRALPDAETDEQRPPSSGSLDNRMLENYERLLGSAWSSFWNSEETVTNDQIKEKLINEINEILGRVLEIKISNLGDVQANKGQLFFEKEGSKDFPFENLSSGEKEVVDIIIDLVTKKQIFNNTVYCIDEPELHLNTAIQRKLLVEIEKLIPENCQLWVATHSIGFLRALQEELHDKSQVLDFSEKDYFNGTKTIKPIENTRKNWQRIFETALEDLVGLIAPHQIIYCEGRPDPNSSGEELGLDAQVYNNIFEVTHPETLFVSGGGNDLVSNASLALTILSKAFSGVDMLLLKDRDGATDQERDDFIKEQSTNKMLVRREMENYLFDKEILTRYCNENGVNFDEVKYNNLLKDITSFDFKERNQSHQNVIKQLVSWPGTVTELKVELSKHIAPDTNTYKALKAEIFGA